MPEDWEEAGYTKCWVRADPAPFWITAEDGLALEAAWVARERHWSGRGVFGNRVILALADVVALVHETAESLAAAKAHQAATERSW